MTAVCQEIFGMKKDIGSFCGIYIRKTCVECMPVTLSRGLDEFFIRAKKVFSR